MDIFKKWATYKVIDFVTLHNLSFLDSSQSTKGTFEQSLKRIEKIYDKPLQELDAIYLRDEHAFLKMLKDSKYSDNTILTTYTQILKVLKMIDAPLNIYSKYVKLLKEKTAERDEVQQLKIEIQKDSLIHYKTLQRELDINEDEYVDYDGDEEGDKFNDLRNFLLIKLFITQIPVRVGNYTKLKITKKSSDYANKDFNWLYMKGDLMMWVFNKYRTSKDIGTKELIITDEGLKRVLLHYITNYIGSNIDKDYLFPKDIYSTKRIPMIAKDINSAILLSSYKIFGQALTIEQLRASYLSFIAEIDPDFNSKMEIASIMGYSNTHKIQQYN